MEIASWTYLLVLILSLAFPLAKSFESRVYMYRKIKYILPGIVITGALFLVWDIWFTKASIWGFNPSYTRELYLLGLPLEEWLFFLVIPYCCIFLYEVLRLYVKSFYYPKVARITIYLLVALLLAALPFVHDRAYTLVAFSSTALILILQLVQKTYKTWFSGFFIAYLLSLVPFMVVNGILTFLPVVWYDDTQNLGVRLLSVPLEDSIYLLGLMLLAVNIYQLLLHRFASPRLRRDMNLDTNTGF